MILSPFIVKKRNEQALQFLSPCIVCPRKCHVNRLQGELGYCRIGRKIRISSFAVHHGEEPPLSGIKGAGNIFIAGCNLSCVFCQNYPISQLRYGRDYTTPEVVDKMLYLHNKQQVHNIIFVTPSHVIPQIMEIIQEARKRGLKVPIGYNSSGYDSVTSLKLLKGLVDIYLPDFKYYDNSLAIKYSNAPNYRLIATKAVREMIRQVGSLKTGKDGIAQKGVLIRHLILPGHGEDSINVVKHIKKHFGPQISISLMNQYFPTYKVLSEKKLSSMNTTSAEEEYQKVLHSFYKLGCKGYYQKTETC